MNWCALHPTQARSVIIIISLSQKPVFLSAGKGFMILSLTAFGNVSIKIENLIFLFMGKIVLHFYGDS